MGAFSQQKLTIDSELVMRSAEEALPPTSTEVIPKGAREPSYVWLYPVSFLAVLGMGIGLSYLI